MSYILHLDTSSENCTVFLSHDGVPIENNTVNNKNEHAALINQFINQALKTRDISLDQINAISVCNGPGSYTGLRVGLSTAKGICFVKNIPLILHNKLDLALIDLSDNVDNAMIAFTARKNEYFAVHHSKMSPTHIFISDLIEFINSQNVTQIFTDDINFPKGRYRISHIENYEPNKINWSKIAIKLLNEKKFNDIAYSEPFYLKQVFISQSKNNILHH